MQHMFPGLRARIAGHAEDTVEGQDSVTGWMKRNAEDWTGQSRVGT